MKLQNLAVIFIIIILPISLVLTSYVQNQIKTLGLQVSYDSKLNNATYDSIKAFQLNTLNSSTSDLANSKIRDIEASVNIFFTTVSSNFNMAGYNNNVLKNYVPALVYTLYDGYYIYSPFTNNLKNTETELVNESEYYDNQRLYGLKPYVYYSCRYQKGTLDVVITYTLDNYITVQGIDSAGRAIDESGYLINGIENVTPDSVQYRGITITKEPTLSEYLGGSASENLYPYIKINGVKYYRETGGRWFSLLNGVKYYQDELRLEENDAALRYYTEAAQFREILQRSGVLELQASDARDEKGNSLSDYFKTNVTGNIFTYEDSSGYIEEPNSKFNQHRLAIIRYCIEKNLSIAIANYNNYSSVNTNFQMPKLKEDEWDKILNNVCMISFLQGLNIGGKIYNGYSIITNNVNEEVVSEDSIYIATRNDNPGEYYRIGDNILLNSSFNSNDYIGVFNVDFERKSMIDPNNERSLLYYYPKKQLGSYTSIINQTNKDPELKENIYQYLDGKNELAKLYYTALGRERYGMYKLNSMELKESYIQQ